MSALVLCAVAVGILFFTPPATAKTVRDFEWYIQPLRLDQAHRLSTGAGITVAVIDSGVDGSHPDLAGRVRSGKGFGPDAAPDGLADADTAEGHGTAMAGLIAGRGNGYNSVLGIAPNATIMPISTGAEPDVKEIADGIRWAVDNGARVINISIGRRGTDVAVADEISAVKYALDHDVVVVAAAGNVAESGTGVAWPAKIPGVLAVSGFDQSFAAWSGSGHGAEVVISAPAVQLIAPAPKSASSNGFVLSDGTSGASAIAAGVVALVRAKFPDLDARNVIKRVLDTARDAGQPGRDPEFGFGAVRPYEALSAAVSLSERWPLPTPSVQELTPQSRSGGTTARVPAGVPVIVALGLLLIVAGLVLRTVRRSGWRSPRRDGACRDRPPDDQPPSYPRTPVPVARPYGQGADRTWRSGAGPYHAPRPREPIAAPTRQRSASWRPRDF